VSNTNKMILGRNIAIVVALLALVTFFPGLNVFKPAADGSADQVTNVDPAQTVILTTSTGGHLVFNGIVSINITSSADGGVASQSEIQAPAKKTVVDPANALPANWSSSTPLQQYSIMSEIKKEQDDASYRQQNAAEKQSEQDILGTLQDLGVSRDNISTNGYVYQFVRNGYYYDVCDQGDRIVGETYKVPHNSSERNMLDLAHIIVEEGSMDQLDGKDAGNSMSISLAQELIEEYGYSNICIDGRPADDIRQLLV